jgi:predicted transcriptional regulator
MRKADKIRPEKFRKDAKMMNEVEELISQKAKINREIPLKSSHSKEPQAQAKILYVLISAGGPLSFEELKEKAKLHKGTLYRHIPILVNRGYIKLLEETCKLSRQKFAIGTYTPELDEEARKKIMLFLEEAHHRGLDEISIQWLTEEIKKPITESARLFIYEEARKRGIKIKEHRGYAIP